MMVSAQCIAKTCDKCLKDNGKTVIIITHNSALTPMADRVVRLKSGSVVDVKINNNPTPIEEIEW